MHNNPRACIPCGLLPGPVSSFLGGRARPVHVLHGLPVVYGTLAHLGRGWDEPISWDQARLQTNPPRCLLNSVDPSVTAAFEDCPAESWFLFGGILLHTSTGVVRNCRQVGAARPRQLVLPLLLRRTRRTQVHLSIVTRLCRASPATQQGRRTAERENQRSGCRRDSESTSALGADVSVGRNPAHSSCLLPIRWSWYKKAWIRR